MNSLFPHLIYMPSPSLLPTSLLAILPCCSVNRYLATVQSHTTPQHNQSGVTYYIVCGCTVTLHVLLHFSTLVTAIVLSKSSRSLNVTSMLATLPAHRNLLHFTTLTSANTHHTGHIDVISILSMRPAHRNLPHLAILTTSGELGKRLATCFLISLLST